jgi:undecaprenyl-diphosphatase
VRALHVDPPTTLAQACTRQPWILPAAVGVFAVLAMGAALDTLPWDRAITSWVVDARTPWADDVFRQVSFLGSTRVVLGVAAVAAMASWRRCPRLAIAIVVIALARPLAEWALKELIDRPRPMGDRMVDGTGPSFPSGHPLATAASWGLLPLVAGLYVRRRWVWWTIAVSVWVLAVLVAASRVWLAVHWTSDVVAALALAVLGVAGAERLIAATHGSCGTTRSDAGDADHIDAQMVDRPVL